MKLVAWDTSGRRLTALLVWNGLVVDWTDTGEDGKMTRHAEHLIPSVQSLLVRNEWTLGEIDAVAYVSGPGSFTGLRIGAAAAKGASFAWSIPVVALSTTEVIANAVPPGRAAGVTILAAIDARKGRYYAALYTLGNPAKRLTDDMDAEPSRLVEVSRDRHVEWLAFPASNKAIPVPGVSTIAIEPADLVQGIARCAVSAVAAERWEATDGGPFYLREGDIGVRRKGAYFEPRERQI